MLSCNNDFLDEKNYGLVTPDTYPASLSDLEKCVSALYSIGNSMWSESGDLCECLGGDDVTTMSGGNKGAYLEFDLFDAHDTNDRISTQWDADYNTIKQANVIINTIDNIKDATESAELVEDQKNRALGQAYFLRGLAYYNLVRIFGEVPIVNEVTVDYTSQKSSFEDIYNQIISDLQKAETLVPLDYSTASNASTLEKSTSYARITTGAVKALMASVYLNWAGYPIKDTSKYALAASKAKEIIDGVANGTYSYKLLSNYADLWKWENGYETKSNAEDVYTCFYNVNAGDWSDNGTNSNGNRWAPSSMYPQNLGGWSDMFAELNFFKEFPEGPRKDATFLTEATIQVDGKNSTMTWKDFTSSHPYYKKYMEIEGFDYENMNTYINWWSSRTVQVIRYAEVLLIYAEAQAMADGTPNSLAYSCLNAVRNRAGLADEQAGLSGEAFRDAVIDERKWEFAGAEPCARWFDMVRTQTVESATAKRSSEDVDLINQPSESHYFAPIPQADKLLNPNLE